MSLYVSEKVGNEIVLKKYAPAVPVYRGFWAVTIGGFAGTLVECNGSMRYIGSNEKTIYQIVEPGTYTFTATRHGETKSKTIVLDDKDPNNSYTINLGLYIGMQYLEYIEADSTQWIDTGIVPHNGYTCELTFQFTSVIPSQGEQIDAQICGVRQSTVSNRFYPIAVSDNGYLRCAYGNTQVVYSSMTSEQILEKHTINLNKNGHIYLDDVDYGSCAGTYVEPQDPQYTMYLFKWNYGSAPYYSNPTCKMKIYSYKLWDNNGDLVSDFIPIKDDTNHGAMYDKVTQQIFYNSGTDEFICGPNLYTRIQYLESTGTQWIDTEHVLTSDNVRYLSKFALKSKNSAAFGSQNPSKSGARFSGIHYFADNGTLYSATGTSDRLCAQGYAVNTVCEIVTIINQGQIQKTQDGVTLSASYAGSVQTDLPIALFGDRFQDGIRETGSGARMYYFKIYENNILVRDFIPVLDSNAVPCMFDQVTNQFFYNAGTGEFIAGPEE